MMISGSHIKNILFGKTSVRHKSLPEYVTGEPAPPGGKLQLVRIESLWQEYIATLSSKQASQGSESIFEQTDLESLDRILHWVEHLKNRINIGLKEIKRLESLDLEFNQRLSRISTQSEKRRLTLDYCKRLENNASKINGDRRALGRWMDADAVFERIRKRKAEQEYQMSLAWDRIGIALKKGLQQNQPKEQEHAAKTWRSLQLEKLAFSVLYSKKDERLCQAAIQALSNALQGFDKSKRESIVSPGTQTFFYRTALEGMWSSGIQMAAFDFLTNASVTAAIQVAKLRLNRPDSKDDLFMRSHCLEWLMQQDPASVFDESGFIEKVGTNDPCPLVRQTFVKGLERSTWAGSVQALQKVLFEEQEVAVRMSAALSMTARILREPSRLADPSIWKSWLTQEPSPMVLRAFFTGLEKSVNRMALRKNEALTQQFCSSMATLIDSIRLEWKELEVRRHAARTQSWLWMMAEKRRRRLLKGLGRLTQEIPVGTCRLIPSRYLSHYTEDEIGRALCCLSQDDFSLTLKESPRGLYLWRGEKSQVRAWKLIHEFLHPAVDKRQAFEHTKARDFPGRIHAPSGRLGELSRTKPPGEPYHVGAEGDWRPYLPLLDEMVSVNQRMPRRVYRRFTPEGIVEIEAPKGLFRSFLIAWKLNFQFPKIANQRDWSEGEENSPTTFLKTLTGMGFQIRIRPYSDGGPEPVLDPSVQRFFPAPEAASDKGSPGDRVLEPVHAYAILATMRIDWKGLAQEIKEYFYSAYGNSLIELTVFATGITLWMIGRQAWLSRLCTQARNQIPLVIGGWGTRGKSGTERIKAALFEYLGHGSLSKSTGCEAMFMISFPYLKTREMFLYRPYDKATIWEHHGLICLAAKMKSRIFLWECMGLTPAYVEILQRRWSRDDISTITNAYPDHEDIQGPAGKDVAEVISGFIPNHSRVVTTEESMLPILREAAKKAQSELMEVNWLEAGMLTPDILQRFPYQEHPFNIALVERLAKELGIPRNVALKEMADRVVADIGVLKTYPQTSIQFRRFIFINGMSANERYGALGNWKRTGMDAPDWEGRKDEWIGGIVNNRADRIPRSKVFASILAKDIHADSIWLIGSNVSGLRGFISESWEEWIDQEIQIKDDHGLSEEEGLNRCRQLSRKMRLCYDKNILLQRIRQLLEPGVENNYWTAEWTEKFMTLWDQPEAARNAAEADVNKDAKARPEYLNDIEKFHRKWFDQWQKLEEFRQQLKSAGSDQARSTKWNELAPQLFTRFFLQKIVPLDDPQATAEIIQTSITQHTPPGFAAKLMGLQNIKGAGLNYVYSWQAWDEIHGAIQQMKADTQDGIECGIKLLNEFPKFDALSIEPLKAALDWVELRPYAQNEHTQSLIKSVRSKIAVKNKEKTEVVVQEKESKDNSSDGPPAIVSKVLSWIEGLIDPGDAIRRRKTANQIYQDLVDERISLARAAEELKILISRQKGGWMIKKVMDM